MVLELDSVSRQVSKLQDSVRALRESIRFETEAISDMESRIRFDEQQMEIKKKFIRERLKALLINSSRDRIELLYDPEVSDDVYREEALLVRLLKDDIKEFRAFLEDIGRLNDLRVLLDAERSRLEQNTRKLSENISKLGSSVKNKKRLLSRIRNSPGDYTVLQKKVEGSSGAIEDMTSGNPSRAGKTPFAGLQTPARGKIISRFGKVWDNNLKNWRYNSGVLIESEYGAEVLSVADGVVKYSGWLPGYGKVAIIKHDNDVFSVSGHLARILYETGERVKKRDIIAYVGDTGPIDSPTLYFSLRTGGRNIDPAFLFK